MISLGIWGLACVSFGGKVCLPFAAVKALLLRSSFYLLLLLSKTDMLSP
jgi:hypothetical protein